MKLKSTHAKPRQDGQTAKHGRRYSQGAEIQPAGVHFRIWAPQRKSVEVVIEGASAPAPLERESTGYFSGLLTEARAGTRYRYRLDGGDYLYPDPVSRFQPDGPHGPSQVIDPADFVWTDHDWKGCSNHGEVAYELHIGTFTPEGTWGAAAAKLPGLVELGITVVEVMPVAEFPGKFGWGYDGVDLFAPTRLYGTPRDFRAFVNRAHELGLAVILDVVYNHIGPDGNYLKAFSPQYFTDRYKCEWGEALNFDGDNSGPVRDFFTDNAAYWIDEFHIDGLRLDATQQIFDDSAEHVLMDIGRRARRAAGKRSVFIVAENEVQHVRVIRPIEQGGYGLDAMWNDDFHHSALVALTGKREAYYSDYHGTPQELISSAKWGFLFQGQRYAWQKKTRGSPAFGVPPSAFVTFIENHDQVANSASGLRCHQLTSPGRHRAMTALMILMPGTPMLFQGQEFSASAPFLFFADHNPELAKLVRKGRADFLAQFPSVATPEARALLAPPDDPQTFARCKLDWNEAKKNEKALALHRDLLRLRRTEPAFDVHKQGQVDGAVLGDEAFLIRYFHPAGDRLLLINLGRDLHLAVLPEPLLAPPEGKAWTVLWSSDSPQYGGPGSAVFTTEEGWKIPAQSALLLKPGEKD
jgi:maltooligosyltrehalose trehalohydrolase